MTPENFCYWLQGYLEISDSKDLDSNQLDIVKDHLKLVFNKITPNRTDPYNEHPIGFPTYVSTGYEPLPQVSC